MRASTSPSISTLGIPAQAVAHTVYMYRCMQLYQTPPPPLGRESGTESRGQTTNTVTLVESRWPITTSVFNWCSNSYVCCAPGHFWFLLGREECYAVTHWFGCTYILYADYVMSNALWFCPPLCLCFFVLLVFKSVCGPLEKVQISEGLKIEFWGIFKQKEQFDPNLYWNWSCPFICIHGSEIIIREIPILTRVSEDWSSEQSVVDSQDCYPTKECPLAMSTHPPLLASCIGSKFTEWALTSLSSGTWDYGLVEDCNLTALPVGLKQIF